jgi:hypothetical protein
MVLKLPTPALVNEYNEKFESDKRYYVADQAIIKLFKHFNENKDIKDIILKIAVINDLYSTNIFATFKMAEHILSLNIDSVLTKGDPEVVNKIAKVTISNKPKNFYSFATKYCNWHNQSKYVIYDSFVEKILKAYRKQTKFCDFKDADLRDYSKFLAVLKKFREYFKLEEFDFKKIDKFLWMYGKEVFN